MKKRRIRNSAAGPVSYDFIVDSIRQEIINGQVSPGARLPTYDKLQQRFGTTRKTVRRACNRLISIGYIQSRPKIGTYVSDTPPHLCRYAIAFPFRPDAEYWTDWWTVLAQAATAVVRSAPPKQIVEFYDITGHADVEDYQRLVGDVRSRRLAGIIFLTPPYQLFDTPLSEGCPVPRVYVGDAQGQAKTPSVAPDLHSFLDRALAHAAAQSRRRPILISPGYRVESTWPIWADACRRNGMEPARQQLLSLPLHPPEAPRHLTQTLMLLPPEHRPDTLIVAEDHFVEEVTAGLLASNLPESQLPTVIAYANFPKTPRALLPVTYLGYDSVRIIRECMAVLDAQRRGESIVENTIIPAIFPTEQSALCSGMETFNDTSFPNQNQVETGAISRFAPSPFSRRER
jgi:DNA-binding LacI/PurR family transcriptional regulator